MISELVGTRDGLSAERSQALRVLPAAMIAGVGESWRDLDPAGLLRAGAILVGLLSAAAGYATTLLRRRP